MSGLNAPDPTEHFILAEGEKKYVPLAKFIVGLDSGHA